VDTMTEQQAVTVPTPRPEPTAAQAPAVPCPAWCNPELHDDGLLPNIPVHHSDPRTWQGTEQCTDAPRAEVSFYRGDELYDNKGLTGTADLDIRLTGGCEWDIGDDGWPVLNGFMSANEARSLGLWLIKMAEEIDPHGTNGQPLDGDAI
jgi:hypothetical protein